MILRLQKRHVWPAIVIGLLAIDTGVGIYLMHVANSDPTVAVEPDYYARAVRWDSTEAQARRNNALGWTITTELGPLGDGRAAAFGLSLRDRSGVPVEGARIEIKASAVSSADNVIRGVLTDSASAGSYATTLPMARAGLWQLQLTAIRGNDRYTADLRVDASTTESGVTVSDRPGSAIPERLRAGMRPMPGTR